MKEHSRVSVNAALLLLLLGGCATTGVETSGAPHGAGTEQEINALAKAFLARLDLRYKEYNDTIAATKAELTRPEAAWNSEGVRKFHELWEIRGRMNSIVKFIKQPAGVTIEQWYASEMQRIRKEEASIEIDKTANSAKIAAWRANNDSAAVDPASPLLQQGLAPNL